MKLLYVNNMPTHHQHAFAAALHARLGDDFRLAYMQPLSAQRVATGWQDLGKDTPWVLRVWESAERRREYLAWMRDADVVCCGTFDMLPETLPEFRERILAGKLCLSYSERIHKIARHPLRLALANVRRRWRMRPLVRPNHHVLTIGTYTAGDYVRAGFPLSRCWQFGYIVSVPEQVARQETSAVPPMILWAGRMISWKKVDDLLRACALVKNRGVAFRLVLLGGGERDAAWRGLAHALGLDDCVEWRPSTNPQQVGAAMAAADIYVLPSNREEGWGVALAEAMAAGCACIAAQEAGATRMLIREGVNGLVFRSGNEVELADRLMDLLTNARRRMQMGQQARADMLAQWQPDVVAPQFIRFIRALLAGERPAGEESGLFRPAKPVFLDEDFDGIGGGFVRLQGSAKPG